MKQFFDENKRLNLAPKSINHEEFLFEGKNRSDFERVKQKFDRSNKSYNSSKRSDRLSSSKGSSSSRKSAADHPTNMLNIKSDCNQSQLLASCSGYQAQTHDDFDKSINSSVEMAESFNIDDFKVSDDDDVSSSFQVTNKYLHEK